ncbi:MAG TPA: hypothetical protein VJG49_00130 [Candidatus Nanoarchaeia archaeon]|nr:hypothetical protein [Candidatus Nanoarchaeia archaeon]
MNFTHRTVGTGIDSINIWTPTYDNPNYSAFYQNNDTKYLDHAFGLKIGYSLKRKEGCEVLYNAQEAEADLTRAVSLASLGHTNAEILMRYFVSLAKSYTVFVGVPEEELRSKIINLNQADFQKTRLRPGFIEQTLGHVDVKDVYDLPTKIKYLKSIPVEGVKVLFPANLKII